MDNPSSTTSSTNVQQYYRLLQERQPPSPGGCPLEKGTQGTLKPLDHRGRKRIPFVRTWPEHQFRFECSCWCTSSLSLEGYVIDVVLPLTLSRMEYGGRMTEFWVTDHKIECSSPIQERWVRKVTWMYAQLGRNLIMLPERLIKTGIERRKNIRMYFWFEVKIKIWFFFSSWSIFFFLTWSWFTVFELSANF